MKANSYDCGPPSSNTKKNGRRISASTEQIWHAVSALQNFKVKQLRDLGFTSDQLKTAIETFRRNNQVLKISTGHYRVTKRKNEREVPVERRIWHAIRINPKWSATDIAIQAGAGIRYVYEQPRSYKGKGFIAPAGVERHPDGIGRGRQLWRMTAKGRKHLVEPPHEAPDLTPFLDVLKRLNNLLMTGTALWLPEGNEAARAACTVLHEKLKEIACWHGDPPTFCSICKGNGEAIPRRSRR